MTQPLTIAPLTVREAVADGLYRALYAIDSNNLELWESAWAKRDDIRFDIGEPLIGIKTINEKLFAKIAALDTTHMANNVRVNVADGGETAHLTAYALAQHYRRGEAQVPDAKGFMTGVQYEIDLLEDTADGLWKMTDFRVMQLWGSGDASVLA